MRHQGFSLWKTSALLCGMGLLGMFIYPVFQRIKDNVQPASCQSNLKQIALGLRQYIQDYDEAFPPVKSGREGWADVAQPYLMTRLIFRCPAVKIDRAENTSDYFYNTNLGTSIKSKKAKYKVPIVESSIEYMGYTILNGDGPAGAATDSAQSSLGPTDIPDSPATRHLDGANYSFVDGHVKWFKPERISKVLSRGKNPQPTFAIK